MAFIKKFIPSNYYKTIYDINYENLKAQGIKTLFFDLDNTIISYDETKVSKDTCRFLNNLKTDFQIAVISNSKRKRVLNALINCNLIYIHHAFKPLKKGLKKAIKLTNANIDSTIMIGDQLMTDIFLANRFNIKSFLIGSVKRSSDRFITKINRALERKVLKRIKKKYPNLYKERLLAYEQDHM